MWKKPESVMPNVQRKGKTWWVARAAGTGDYYGWETNEGTAWVSLKGAHKFDKKDEARNAISVPVMVEICEIDEYHNILAIEKGH